MPGRISLALLVTLLTAPAPALARAPETSAFPVMRPVQAALVPILRPVPTIPPADPVPLVPAGVAPDAAIDEAPALPVTPQPRTRTASAGLFVAPSRQAVPQSAPPMPRPEGLQEAFSLRLKRRDRNRRDDGPVQSRGGSICGVSAIKGTAIDSIGGNGTCGIANPVRVTSVSGVSLSPAATLNCTTAKALNTWVRSTAKPAFSRRGGGLATIQVAASYACRSRNSQPDAKISEHAKGNAIDIPAFLMDNGERVSVQSDYGRGAAGRALKKARKGACGTFGTVLGPGSDRFHEDHFHLDTARYRGGPYCK